MSTVKLVIPTGYLQETPTPSNPKYLSRHISFFGDVAKGHEPLYTRAQARELFGLPPEEENEQQEEFNPWTPMNIQIAMILANSRDTAQREEARRFFAHHLNLLIPK